MRVRKGDTEIEVSGTTEEISSSVSALKDAMRDLTDILTKESANVATANYQSNVQREAQDIPTIGKTNSGSEAIVKLLSSDWGTKPRSMGELKSALEANAMPIPATTISGVLNYLVKSSKVRRWKTPSGYVYRISAKT